MRELLKQALDALEIAYPKRSSYISNSAHEVDADKHDAVVRAILAALAKQEQGPVAWMYTSLVDGIKRVSISKPLPHIGTNQVPLYAAAGAKGKT